jgi:tetratricopeptide (TPR) repeat protein
MKKTVILFFAIFLLDVSVAAQEIECDSVNDLKEQFGQLFYSKESKKAIVCGNKLLAAWNACNLEHDSVYCAIAMAMSNLYYYTGDIQQSIQSMEEIIPTVERVFGKNHMDYVKSISDLALYYYSIVDYKEAIRLQLEVADIIKQILGTNHVDYANVINSLATYYYYDSNYSEAFKYGKEVMDIRKELLGEEHPLYLKSLTNLALYLSGVGNYEGAIHYATEAMSGQKRTMGIDNPDYAISLGSLAHYYSLAGNYTEAIRLGIEAIEVDKKVFGANHKEYATAINNIAQAYSYIGNYSEAIKYGTQSSEVFKNVFGENHPNYAISLGNLASYYHKNGNLHKTLNIAEMALKIFKETLGQDHFYYVTAIHNLAILYSEIGDYNKGLEYDIIALEKTKTILGEEHPDYAKILNSIGNRYFEVGNATKALDFYEKALNIQNSVLGENHPDYLASLNNIAHYYSEIEDNTKAIEYGNKVLEKARLIYGENHPAYASFLSNLGNYYDELGNLSIAIDYYNKSLTIFKLTLEKSHPDYIRATKDLAILYYKKGDFSKAYDLLYNVTSILTSNVTKVLGTLTSRQRYLFWSQNFDLFTDLYPSFFYKAKSNETTNLYDMSALFSKELLLSTEIEMSRLIKESGDEEALKLFEDLRLQRLQIQQILEQPVDSRPIDIDSLEFDANQLERKLISRCNAYGDFTNRHALWKDIQNSLSDDEMAVEFLSFMIPKTDSIIVAALTLRKGNSSPKFYPLFELKQLQQIKDENHYISPKLTSLVWKPLENEFLGIKRIYFSPAGALNRIGIEYAPAMEKYEMYRLSSTRNIIDIKKMKISGIEKENAMVLLYGGINYEKSDSLFSEIDAENYSTSIEIAKYLHRSFIDSLELRGYKLSYLPSTLTEVRNISTSLNEANISNTVITGQNATETSIKKLTSNIPSILHISTHGFYYPEEQVSKSELLRSMKFEEKQSKWSNEDRILARSGLFMAGAYQTIVGQKEHIFSDDGILTAQEISNIDLRGVDLVVLSACETGSGDVTRGEGVFGLQRGFKKAGVKSILMSLWKVSDISTEMLMTEFYKNLCKGRSKRESLRLAQKKVREYQDSDGNYLFQEPHYWAGFVMLD